MILFYKLDCSILFKKHPVVWFYKLKFSIFLKYHKIINPEYSRQYLFSFYATPSQCIKTKIKTNSKENSKMFISVISVPSYSKKLTFFVKTI